MKPIKLTLMAVMTLLSFQSGFSQTIVGTAHDFKAATWNPGGQVCIVCHTPHNAKVIADAPLWNRQLSAQTSYVLYTSATSSTFNATTTQPDGNSKLCLGCHDGTIALEHFGTVTTGGTNFVTGTKVIGGGSPASISDDHPISFVYDGALVTADGGLWPTTTLSGIGSGTIASTMLFAGKMQCASCHDVHNGAGFTAGLLVKTNAQSALCLTCHKK